MVAVSTTGITRFQIFSTDLRTLLGKNHLVTLFGGPMTKGQTQNSPVSPVEKTKKMDIDVKIIMWLDGQALSPNQRDTET